MPMVRNTHMQGLAERALADAGILEPPVDLTEVAMSLCVPIHEVRLPGFFRGALINEDGMPSIVLNAGLSEHRRQDVLGHLLGHVLIVLDGGSYPRDSQVVHPEADALAVELLLPKRMVAEQSNLWFKDYRYLARMFAVDEGAMVERMRALGILSGPRGVGWEY